MKTALAGCPGTLAVLLLVLFTSRIHTQVPNTTLSGCLGNQFACNSGQCVKQEFLCNGVTNCEDESDEQVCNQKVCPNNQWACPNAERCIPITSVCDGKNDCDDGADEVSTCSSSRCGWLSCLYRCNPSPEGGMCYCADGMALKSDDKRTCIDFNECSSWGYCDQICTNKENGYTCSCQEGFTLTGKQMCRANNSENARLIVSSNKRIFSMKTDGSDIKLIATTSLSPVAFDSRRNKIFWASGYNSKKQEFWESDLSGENKRSIPLKTTFKYVSLAYDWIANNLYYEDKLARIIGILNLDSGRQCNIITSGLTRTFSIALDPLVGYMFFILWGHRYQRVNGVYRAFMDGSNIVYFKTSKYTFPSGFTVDIFSKRIYLIDSHFDQVLTFDYNGLNRFEIVAGAKYILTPVAITHFESHLFWADKHKGKIMKMNKNGSISTLTEIYHNSSEVPNTLEIFHSALQPQGRNPCKQAKCQHICVVTHTSDNDGLGYRCLCQIGFVPDSSQMNCTRVNKFILISKRNIIQGLPLDRKSTFNANAILPVTNTFSRSPSIKSLDYTSSDQTIYFADLSSSAVFKFNLNTSELKVVFNEYVYSISVDWMLRNLYVANRRGITVVRIDNVDDKRVIISNETSAAAITCHPYKGLIFFTSHFYTKLSYIGRAFADGSNVKHIRQHELGIPYSLSIDFKADHLYWSDYFFKRIQRSDLDGNNVQTLGIMLTNPVRIFVYGDDLYILSYLMLMRTKKTGDSPLEILTKYKRYALDFNIYDKDLQKIEASNPCIRRNGDCTHFCFAVPMTQDILHGHLGRHCDCPYGMKLDVDLRTCINHTEYEPPEECPPTTFQCKNKRCISHYRVCNQHDNCFDNSDEVNCTSPSRNCAHNQFKCPSGMCIPQRWICDKYNDCPDNIDEKDCNFNCSSSQFRCNNGLCIHQYQKCNSYPDCTDGSDEGAFCANHTCFPSYFKCDGYKCIPLSYRCNGRRNCRDGSDERNCPDVKCSSYQWKCPNSNICIHKMRRCNGLANCEDGADEAGCNVTTAEGCREGYFRCLGGSCLPNNWRCDGHKDCESGSDENSTCTIKPCPTNQVQCKSGLCIYKHWVCDYINDCGDNSDEGAAQNCPSPTFRCPYGQWECPGGHQICISQSKVCDGKTDCPGGTDESTTCNSNSCAFNKGGCAFKCLQTPFGAQCLCPAGQEFNINGTCVDLNECEPPGICSQHCLNLEGSYKCTCDTGYQSERNLCLANENTTVASLIVVGMKSFTNISLDFQPYEEINIVDAKRIIASDIDILNQTIYFFDFGNRVISRIKTNGSDQTVVVQSGMIYVVGLAVDWIGRNLYWTDSSKRTIEVSNLRGDHRMILLKQNQSRPRAIKVDPREDFRYLFWTEWQVNPSIHRIDLDGENEIVIVNKKLFWPVGLAIDFPNKRLYFIEGRMDYIGFCGYDGSGRTQLFANEHYIIHPRGFTIFEDTIYWTEPYTNKLTGCHKFNCKTKNLIQTSFTRPMNVISYHPVRQPPGINSCSSKPCSHLCLLSKAAKGYKCVCPPGMKPSQDSKTCVDAQDEYLLYAFRDRIKDIDLQNSAPRSSSFMAIFDRRKALLDFDYNRKTNYVYYISERSSQQTITQITTSGLNKTSWPAELFLGKPNSLAIDWISRNLFWSSTDSKSIHVMKMNSNFTIHKIILGNSGKQTDVSFPTSLCLDPSKGLLYWTDKGSYDIPVKIGAVKMDGSDPQILVKDNMQTPGFLTKDPNDPILYWSDGQLGKIEKYNILRSEREVILNGLNFVTGIAVYKGYLYYCQKDMETLSYVALSALNYGSSTMKTNVGHLGTLRVVYNWNKYPQTTNCADSNYGNCEQLCLPTGTNTHKCDCAIGFKLNSNNQCTIVSSFYVLGMRYGVRGFSFDAENQNDAMVPVGGVHYISYIDVLVEEKYIYYVAQFGRYMNLCRRRQNGSDFQFLLQSDGGRLFVRGIAVDWIAGNLYYVNSIVSDTFIEVCRLNGTYRKVILEDRSIYLQGLTVNPIKRYLYWTSRGANARLERSLLDGTNRTLLVSNAISHPLDITVDIKTHDVYWVDDVIDAIQRISFSGGNRVYIRTNLPKPYGISVFNNDVYWVDRNLNQVLKVDKTSRVGAPTVVKKNVRYLSDIAIFDKSNQPSDPSNPCSVNNGGCDQLCFAIAGSPQPVCKCVEGDLDSDGQKCKPSKEFLLMAIASRIQTISLHPNRTNQKVTTIAATGEVSGVGYDAKSNQIYYGINNPAAIVRYDVETKTSQQFVIDPVNKLAFIGKIAVDWTGKKIYWTDALYNRISVMSFDSTYKANLLTTQKPKSIVLDPCKGYMYWSNSGIGQSPSIEKATMAGNQRSVLVSSDLGDPDGLAIDYTYEKLYWADTLKNQIERISLDGHYRDVIVATTYEPTSITVFGLYIYWISSFRWLMYRAEKHTGANTIRMTKYLTSFPDDIVVFSADLQNCKLDPCQLFNGGCSQGCHPAPNGEAECSCNGTSSVVSKYKTCIPQNHNCSDTEFVCSNGKCIYKSWVCDQDDDCKDGSDENSNLCATHTCEKTQYRCNNGRCINHLFRCDFDDDCLDNSDEIGCDASTCGPAQFTCKNYRCIDAEQVCDGYDQCRDGEQTDEKNCPNNMTCPENRVKCPNSNVCIRIHLLCDGDNDCGDNSDENVMFCKSANCTGHFRCLQANRCIPSSWYCDGTEDCASGEDEPTNCHVNLTCASNMFACGSGGCIYKAWLCDGENDCSDGSDETIDCRNIACAADEFNCTHNRNIGIYPCIKKKFVCDGDKNCADGEDERQSCPPDVCDDNEFACANGGCIQSKFVCDREDDCGDRSDEHGNCEYPECGEDLFTCDNKRCILNSWVCDGDNDCHDNSDEKESVCLTPAPTCPPGQFRCDNGECINYLLACNKNPDCSDQTDERHCYINECEDVTIHRCEHTCVDTLTSYHCECNPGYTLMTDRKACRDIDECLEKPGTCSQVCHNTVGNYSCKCNEGYMRGLDTHSCKKKDDEIPWLVFGNRHYIRKMTLDGLNYQLIAQGLREVFSLDFDYQEQKLYFSDTRIYGIQAIFINGTNQKVHFNKKQFGLNTIAVDWVCRKLYWSQLYIRALFVSEMNGTSLLTLNTHSFYHVRFLVAYPPTGYLYFIDNPSKSWIGRIGMDGSNYQRLITDGLGSPTGLTIDFESERMWWADAHFDAIEYANLDGTNRQTVMKENVPFIHSLAVFEDWIYWTDLNHLSIEKAHKFTGRNHTILRNMTHQPSNLVVFHSLRQKQYKNPCGSNNGGCSHLCLHSPPDDYVCACPDFFFLDADNKTCIANCSTSQFRCGKGDARCIPFYYRCDQVVDCHDGSDELNCPESTCQPHTFTCNNRNCTYFYQICDSKDDCGDGSDEYRCDENHCAPWLFRCNSGYCVYRSWQCDGINDCLDNSDEDIALCAQRSCGVHEFTCDNGYCVPEHDKCDYENDCFDGSDESPELNCANQTCPETSFQCETNYRCIPLTYVCDGYDSCGDNSDEKLSNCKKCNETKEFKCKNNVCIPKTWVCDSKADCRDRSDEDPSYCKNKYRDCTEAEFRCDNQRCVLNKWRCNQYDDCGDGSDETNCGSVKCSEDEFKCDSGHCIKNDLTCNSWRNCRDASDEKNCTPRYGDRYCPNHKFQCNNTVCIPKQWMCDSDNDCGDKSDETRKICLEIECLEKERRFRCDNLLCLPIWRVCNGEDDCGDASDENTHHVCQPKEEICEQDQFKCTSKECIDAFKVCNEIADCADKSDEIGCIKRAGAVNCSIDNGGCPHNCTDLEGGGMICSCRRGFKMKDEKTKECVDINECELSNNKCPQLCDNIKGSYKCLCHEGFQDPLLPTPKCKYTKEGKVSIFMSVGSGIRRFDPIIKEYMSTLLSIQRSQGLAVDVERSTLYWTDMISKTVMRSYISKKSDNVGVPQDLKLNNLEEPNGISIDWISGNVYWTDSKKKSISVAAKDGRYRYTLIKTELRSPYAIVVNSQTGWMYWTDINSYNPKIERSWMTGERRQVLVNKELARPSGIAIDYFMNNRVFWSDSKFNRILSMKPDGTDQVVVIGNAINPVSIDLYESEIYWVSQNEGKLMQMDKFGRGINITLRDQLFSPSSVIAFQPYKYPKTTSKCASEKTCSHLCLLIPNGYRCACPDGSKLIEGSTTLCDAAYEVPRKLPMCICYHGGSCIQGSNGTYICHCKEGYYGVDCSLMSASGLLSALKSTKVTAITVPIVLLLIMGGLTLAGYFLIKKRRGQDGPHDPSGVVAYRDNGNIQIDSPNYENAAEMEIASIENEYSLPDPTTPTNFSNPMFGMDTPAKELKPSKTDEKPPGSPKDKKEAKAKKENLYVTLMTSKALDPAEDTERDTADLVTRGEH